MLIEREEKSEKKKRMKGGSKEYGEQRPAEILYFKK